MLNKVTISFILVYGLLIMAFGCYGYFQGGSKISLWSGVACCGLLVLSALSLFARQTLGIYVSLTVTALLTAIFSYRYAITHSSITAILAVLSGGMLLFLFARFGKWKAE